MVKLTLTLYMRFNVHAHVDVDLAVARSAYIACMHVLVKTHDENRM